MKTDSWRRRTIGLRKWWKSSLDKRKSLWIVKGREVKQTDPQMIFRKLLLRSFSFLYKEGISRHESKESEATESGNLQRVKISLWKSETKLNIKMEQGFWEILLVYLKLTAIYSFRN